MDQEQSRIDLILAGVLELPLPSGGSMIGPIAAPDTMRRGEGDTIEQTAEHLSSETRTAQAQLRTLLKSVAGDQDRERILDHSHLAPRPLIRLRATEKRGEP